MPRRRNKAGVCVCLLFFLIFSFPLLGEEPSGDKAAPVSETPSELDVEALRGKITDEAPGELVNLSLGDSSVSLNLAGRWTGTLQGSWGLALTPFGTTALTGDTPLFTQEGELTLSLWILDRWFVETSFMDDSALNTYRAGYQGKEGEVIRYAGVGNTGLDFPAFPYLDLGGDTPSSFGAYGHFAVGNLNLHSLIRYDAAAREEKVFVGNRERSYGYADLSRPQRGIVFVLPDENLDGIPEVYIQDNKGDLRDLQGRRWRLAEPSEYGASARYGLVELSLGAYTAGSSEPEGMIAVYYPPGVYSLGKYYGAGSDNTFLRKIQEYFDASADLGSSPSIRLWDYPQPGQRGTNVLGDPDTNIPGTVSVNGNDLLVIYEPGTFSPFEKQNRYLAPANTSSQADFVKLSTGETIPGYEVIPLGDDSLGVIIQNPEQTKVSRGVYELIQEGARDRRSPEECWPLGSTYPGLYLPGRTAFTEDLGIRFTNYSAAGAFFIGADVIPGSVQIYRNGIMDPNFVYNPSVGTVSLGNPPAFSEVIRITYLRQSSERRFGSLAAGIGAIWENEGPFSAKLGLGLRWNVSSDTYSENGAASPGTVGLGAEAKWNYDRLRAGLTLGLGFEQPDTTGLYRAAGMEGNEITLSLPPGNSFISETPVSLVSGGDRANLIYRNYRDNSILGSNLTDIGSSGSIISGETGPYPATDKNLSSQVLVAEFNFSSGETWTGFQTPLGLNGEYLERAGKIEVPFRFSNFDSIPAAGEISVKLQIGALADKDSGYPENQDLQIELELYPPDDPRMDTGSIDPSSFDSEPRLAVFNLSDKDRAKLQGAKYLRLLVEGSSGVNGRVILAPPIVRGTLWRPVTLKGTEIISPALNLGFNAVNAFEGNDPSLGRKYGSVIDRLHSGSSSQRVLEITWEAFSLNDTGPGADGRIPLVPLSSYHSLSFFVRRPWTAAYDPGYDDNDPTNNSDQFKLNQGTLRFILARGPSSLQHPGEIALEAAIPLTVFRDNDVKPGEWTRVDVQYGGANPKVLVGGKTAAGSTVRFRSSAAANSASGNTALLQAQEDASSYAAFLLIPGSEPLPKGDMAVDEIILEDPVPSYRLNNGASVEWTLPGTVLQINDTPVIGDISFQAAVETGAQGNPFEDQGEASSSGSFGMNGRTQAGVSLFGTKLSGNYSYSLTVSQGVNTDYTWSGGHGLFRAFGPFSINESFDDAPADKTMNHRLGVALDTRVRGNLSGEAVQEDDRLRRRWQAGTGGQPNEKIPLDFSVDALAGINEKNVPGGRELSNYASDWVNSFSLLVPDSGANTDGRDLQGSFRIRLNTAPLGTELYFQGTSSFSLPGDTSQTGSLLRLDFPLNPGGTDLRLLFRNEREYRRSILGLSGDFRGDSELWGGSFGDALPLMFSIPFYSLFDPRMGRRMNEFGYFPSSGIYSGFSPDSVQFADRFEFSLQQAMNYGLSSLFVPRSISLRLARILEQKLDIPRDTLNLGVSLGFSSVNMFGAMGAVPVFSFYQGDEFSHSLETQVSFPKGEDVSWSVRADQNMLFYGFSGAELGVNNTLTVNSSNRTGEGSRWTDSLTASWTVPMEKSLLGTLYASFTRMAREQSSWLTLSNLAQSEYELLRRENLEFVFERIPDIYNGDYNRFSIVLGHESIVRIFGKLNLSVFGKLTVAEDYNTRVLSFMGTIGTSLNLIF